MRWRTTCLTTTPMHGRTGPRFSLKGGITPPSLLRCLYNYPTVLSSSEQILPLAACFTTGRPPSSSGVMKVCNCLSCVKEGLQGNCPPPDGRNKKCRSCRGACKDGGGVSRHSGKEIGVSSLLSKFQAPLFPAIHPPLPLFVREPACLA